MRCLLFVILLVFSLGAFAEQPVQDSPITDPAKLQSRAVADLQNFTVEKLFSIRNVGGSSWSPDGKQTVFSSNMSGHQNLWLIPAGGGWPGQLTISDQRQDSPVWAPDGTWIAFVSDHNGDQQWRLSLVSPKTGDILNLTTSEDTSEKEPAWSPNGRQLAYISKDKTASSYEVELMDIATRHVTHLTKDTPKELSNSRPIFSRDGKFVAYTQSNADGRDSNVFAVDLASDNSTNLTSHEGEHNHAATDISPDSKSILITSDAKTGYDNVALVEIATHKITWLSEGLADAVSGIYSPDGKYLTWTAERAGNSNIFSYDLAANRAVALALKEGVNSLAGSPSPFSRDGARLLYYRTSAIEPKELWTYDFASTTSQQVTHSLVAGVRTWPDMVLPTYVQYASRDGKWKISALAYISNNIQQNHKYPAIVYVHDGPAAQSIDAFDPFVQYIVNQGYIVIAPNYRGSTGYGEQFANANRGDLGGADVDDVLDAAEWIKQSAFVDPKKLIVMGDGYGAYLTLMALAKQPELWAAGIAIDPFLNWSTRLVNEDPVLREIDIARMGDPVKNKALYEQRSPLNLAERIQAPVLLLAAGNSPASPKQDLQQMSDALKKKGGVVQRKTYDNEVHGLTSLADRIDAYQRVSDFLKVRVPSPGCGCSIYE